MNRNASLRPTADSASDKIRRSQPAQYRKPLTIRIFAFRAALIIAPVLLVLEVLR